MSNPIAKRITAITNRRLPKPWRELSPPVILPAVDKPARVADAALTIIKMTEALIFSAGMIRSFPHFFRDFILRQALGADAARPAALLGLSVSSMPASLYE
jgi:hypothetical protein